MKNEFKLIALFALSILFFSSCDEEEDSEECVSDEVCEAEYTTCCTDDVCVYEYNGTEYTDEDDLVAAIDCSSTAVVLESIRLSVARAQGGL